MNKLNIAAGALLALAATGAAAQSSVTVYGVIDTGVLAGRFSNLGTTWFVSPNTITASRLGFSGSEDLGGGLRAGFQIEHGIFPDTGTAGGGAVFWNRGSWVSLSSKTVGEVRLGRQRSPMFALFLAADPSGYGIASLSSFNVLHGQDALYRSGTTSFYDNMLVYRSPNIAGFSADAGYSLGTEQAGAPKRDGKTGVLTGQYKAGPLWVGAGLQHFTQYETATTSNRTQKTALLGAKYVVGPATIAADWIEARRSITGRPGKSSGFGLQAQIRVGSGDIDVGVATLKESGNRKATAFHLGYLHHLSKRTGVYAYAGRTANNAQASYTYGSELRNGQALTPVGFDPMAVTVGIRHGF